MTKPEYEDLFRNASAIYNSTRHVYILLMKQKLHLSFPSSLTRKPSNGRKHTWHLFGMTMKGSNTLHSKNSSKFSVYFRPINQTQTANNQLISLRQGKRTVEEYLAEFRLLTSLAGMMSDTPFDQLLSMRLEPSYH